MATRTVEDQPDLTIPEDTIVRAKLMEIKDKDIEWTVKGGPDKGQKKTATLAQFWWEVQDERFTLPDGRKRKLLLECDAKVTNHPHNRFRQVAEALLGRELPAGLNLDDEDLVGLSADLSIKHEHYEKNGENRIAEKVDEVIPIRSTEEDIPF